MPARNHPRKLTNWEVPTSPAEPREMPLFARNAAICCIWPLEPGPEPQMARNGRSSPPRSRRILEKCLPRNRRMPDGCRSSHPGGAECSTGAARACPVAAAGSKSAARAHSREVRSFLALEMAARKVLAPVRLLSASTFARLHFASCMLCTGSHYSRLPNVASKNRCTSFPWNPHIFSE